MGREAMEAQVIRTFLETVAELPWSQRSAESLDIAEAEQILDNDHYGLGDVKDRILEFLSVRQLREDARKAAEAKAAEEKAAEEGAEAADDATAEAKEARAEAKAEAKAASKKTAKEDEVSKAPILLSPALRASARPRSPSRSPAPWAASTCGSPSAARATRPTSAATAAPTWARMPGRILQGMKQAGTKNPVFLLDEIDKLGASLPRRPVERRCSRCSTRRRTTRSPTTTWSAVRPRRRCCSSRTANSLQNLPGRCSTAWR